MSRTYNHKPSRFYEPDGLYEYNESFLKAYIEKWSKIYRKEWIDNNPDIVKPPANYDVSNTMNGIHDEYIPYTTAVRRHPNKKTHKQSLGKEFSQTSIEGIRYYRRPYGEVSGKSYRMKGVRKMETRLRRARQKEQFKNILINLD